MNVTELLRKFLLTAKGGRGARRALPLLPQLRKYRCVAANGRNGPIPSGKVDVGLVD